LRSFNLVDPGASFSLAPFDFAIGLHQNLRATLLGVAYPGEKASAAEFFVPLVDSIEVGISF
jgi:hypothetical protein